MAKVEKHIFEENAKGHHPEKGTEGGACLTGHMTRHANFRGKCSCNYRYQALEQAKSHSKIKERLHSYNKKLMGLHIEYVNGIPTLGEWKESGIFFPQKYSTKIPVPQLGDWDVGGPKREIKRDSLTTKASLNNTNTQTIKIGHNFTQETWPYWNNAHHLIPKGTFASLIVDEEHGPFLEKGLLKAKYNINHKINMLLLPQDKEVAKILDMPRHIQFKVGDDSEIVASAFNHPVYNAMVKDDLKKIIKEYAEIVKEKKCEAADFELDKTKLEQLSADLLNLALSWSDGMSLDSHAKNFRKRNKL